VFHQTAAPPPTAADGSPQVVSFYVADPATGAGGVDDWVVVLSDPKATVAHLLTPSAVALPLDHGFDQVDLGALHGRATVSVSGAGFTTAPQPVGLPGATPEVPTLAAPAAPVLPSHFHELFATTAQGASRQDDDATSAVPAGRWQVAARCYGPGDVAVRVAGSDGRRGRALGRIRCDFTSHTVVAAWHHPAGARAVVTVQAPPMTAYRVAFGNRTDG
jgi:hypothetical protein